MAIPQLPPEITSMIVCHLLKSLDWSFESRQRTEVDNRVLMLKDTPKSVKYLQLVITDTYSVLDFKRAIMEGLTSEDIEETRDYADKEDELSTHIRIASQGLESLWLFGVIGNDMLWPMDPSDQLHLPFWPKLKQFSLCFVPITPRGRLMFTSSEIEGMSPMDLEERMDLKMMNAQPEEDVLNEFYYTVAQAMLRMPQLIHIQLRAHIAPGKHEFILAVGNEVVKSVLCAAVYFAPEDRVMDMFHKFARDRGREFSFRTKDAMEDCSRSYTPVESER
ncbi:hypothetical protein DL769_008185 [Monosporascus sp. CRB-8-3]|nr:hypothetical protein DL769_008185 [Monosporascus sp. CRB-8-3]